MADPDPAKEHSVEAADQQKNQHTDSPRPPAGAETPATPEEPDFERIFRQGQAQQATKPVDKESAGPQGGSIALPRWLVLTMIWGAGLVALTLAVSAAYTLTRERKTDRTLELIAMHARGDAQPGAAAPPPADKPAATPEPPPVARLINAPPIDPKQIVLVKEQPAPAASAVPAAKAVEVAARPVRRTQGARSAGDKRVSKSVASTGRKAAPAGQRHRLAASAAQQAPQRGKRAPPTAAGFMPMSDSERVNAAVRRCKATATTPAQCQLRVCDVLGPSHPACRE